MHMPTLLAEVYSSLKEIIEYITFNQKNQNVIVDCFLKHI